MSEGRGGFLRIPSGSWDSVTALPSLLNFDPVRERVIR